MREVFLPVAFVYEKNIYFVSLVFQEILLAKLESLHFVVCYWQFQIIFWYFCVNKISDVIGIIIGLSDIVAYCKMLTKTWGSKSPSKEPWKTLHFIVSKDITVSPCYIGGFLNVKKLLNQFKFFVLIPWGFHCLPEYCKFC